MWNQWKFSGYGAISEVFPRNVRAPISFIMSYLSVWLSVWNNSAPTGWILVRTEFYWDPATKFSFGYKRKKITGTLHEDPDVFYGTDKTTMGCYGIEALAIPFSNFTHKITKRASKVTLHVHFLCFRWLLTYSKAAYMLNQLDFENVTRKLAF
jgi:hypothetical protein